MPLKTIACLPPGICFGSFFLPMLDRCITASSPAGGALSKQVGGGYAENSELSITHPLGPGPV